MLDWRNVPVFGLPDPRLPTRIRPSAYALIADAEGRVAVVRAPDGTYLPGGGIEPGESPEQAVAREAMEECGLLVRVGVCACRAVQYALNDAGDACQEKRCWFFEAAIEGAQPERMHPGHETLWVPPQAAGRFLLHESQVWAVENWPGLRLAG